MGFGYSLQVITYNKLQTEENVRLYTVLITICWYIIGS